MLTKISLVANHLMVIWNTGASNLNACIDILSNEFEFQAKFKIFILLVRSKKLIPWNPVVMEPRNDRAVFNPEVTVITVPAVKGSSIKQAFC